MLKIELNRLDDSYHFRAVGSAGVKVDIDGKIDLGLNLGARPMELLLMGLASCSSVDVIDILKKQKQEVKNYKVIIEAERAKDKIPSIFTDIIIHFYLTGNIEEKKAKRAVELSIEKYCSVSEILRKSAKLEYKIHIN